MSGKTPTLEQRKAHQTYLRDNSHRLLAAGPTFDPGCESPEGSIFLIEAEDFSDARAFVEQDPYFQFGMRDRVDIYAWRPAGYARTYPISVADI